MVEEINENKRKWQNHAEKIPAKRLSRQAYFYHSLGRRDIGRPRRKWAQIITRSLNWQNNLLLIPK
jgi:hypothetical protein